MFSIRNSHIKIRLLRRSDPNFSRQGNLSGVEEGVCGIPPFLYIIVTGVAAGAAVSAVARESHTFSKKREKRGLVLTMIAGKLPLLSKI